MNGLYIYYIIRSNLLDSSDLMGIDCDIIGFHGI